MSTPQIGNQPRTLGFIYAHGDRALGMRLIGNTVEINIQSIVKY